MGDNDILWKAVSFRHISEVEEILKQCTQEILEYRGGEVSVSIIFKVGSCYEDLSVPSYYL